MLLLFPKMMGWLLRLQPPQNTTIVSLVVTEPSRCSNAKCTTAICEGAVPNANETWLWPGGWSMHPPT
jgi:hypothetical protein